MTTTTTTMSRSELGARPPQPAATARSASADEERLRLFAEELEELRKETVAKIGRKTSSTCSACAAFRPPWKS